MTEKTYRVIQWATGVVGQTALKHFIENPVIDLVGVYVTNPEKVGKDAAMPWQTDGITWHTKNRISGDGKPAR